MEGNFIHVNKALLPLSWLYGLGVRIRNLLFDVGLLRRKSYDIPVIAVGNITVGGTGKTPHVEYLVRLLEKSFQVAVLSRGYKRKTSGYLEATSESSPRDIGDEPTQMKQKFPEIVVAVDKKRTRGIERLMADKPELAVVLLDDAFQHRYVKPGINILLVDFHRLIINDYLLPAGQLREPLNGKNRADIIIVTKCPREQTPMDYRVLTKSMDLYPYQQLFFSTMEYEDLAPVFSSESKKGLPTALAQLADYQVLLLSGIASPRQLINDLEGVSSHLVPLTFSDHHDFTARDVERINNEFGALSQPRCIVTTEKDAARLRHIDGLSPEVRRSMLCLPVRVRFLLGQEEKFNETIIGYVRKNSRNSILAKAKDDYKSHDGYRFGNGSRTISFRNN